MKHSWRATAGLLCLLLLLSSCTGSGLPEGFGQAVPVSGTGTPELIIDPTPLAQAFLAGGVVDTSKRDYSYDEMVGDLQMLASLYPDRLSLSVIGQSVGGRALHLAVLGNPNAPRQLVVTAAIHGREYLTALLVMKQLEFYLTYYDSAMYAGRTYEQLFSECAVYIVPMVNPDGVMLSEAGIASVTDPTLRAAVEAIFEADRAAGYTTLSDLDTYLQYWKANLGGVDLNRNYNAKWDSYYSGRVRPSSERYKGPAAASEPETRALVELINSLSAPQALLSMHSKGEILYWNCGQPGVLSDTTFAFTAALGNRTGYAVDPTRHNDASLTDWAALKKGMIAVTVETGTGVCPLSIDEFPTIWNDNFDLIPLTAAYFR